ncbi:Aste57867_21085 [Aphanomyces stellatus]|uniref:non-specific serine/threonine protein kinase n=1 Tax=Aphanomyces stellatus TaxID=120398 RepID=A0A485LGL0_9STRA|nr:hypothetical protein As57867_021017 [Aphanomyces stellatus]VFT97759.1 Aste57867_21085 [Aphanomyces stellatus]
MDKLSDAQRELFRSGGCLDDYEILKPIGKGKFSVVYRAKRRRDGVLVALKKVNIFNLMDAKAREKTLKEVRLVQSVHHPNIIQYLDAFIGHDDELCIAFEWAEAGDLKRQIRKANEKNVRFDERTIWTYFGQICAAIEHMHVHRIMHRDIKPANIFLTLAGAVKVGDLGLGRYLSENTMEAHSKVGTPLYMSPEVLRGDGYDWKCDVWSLGCILYELAMLRSPFKSEGLNLHGLFQKVNKGVYDPVSDVYSETLRSLVAQMLSLNANDRPTMTTLCRVSHACSTHSDASRPKDNNQTNDDHNDTDNNDTDDRRSIASREKNDDTLTLPRGGAMGTGGGADEARGAWALMDILYDKLVLMGYQTAQPTPLSRIYFAIEGRRTDQFTTFTSLVDWLFGMLHVALDVDVHSATVPPLRKATAILVGAGLAGVDVGVVSPAALTPGFGAAVCSLLNAACDKALQLHKPSKPVWPMADPVDVSSDGLDDTAVAWGGDDDDGGEDSVEWRRDIDGGVAPRILVPSTAVDPTAWRAEIEKNMPTVRRKLHGTPNSTPWTHRLDAWRSSMGVLDGWKHPGLVSLHETVRTQLDQVETKERLVNAVCLPWREQYQRRKDAEMHLANHRQALETVRAQLVERFDSTAAAAAAATAEASSRGDALTDTGMLVALKKGLQSIRADVAKMDMAIAVHGARHFRTYNRQHNPTTAL